MESRQSGRSAHPAYPYTLPGSQYRKSACKRRVSDIHCGCRTAEYTRRCRSPPPSRSPRLRSHREVPAPPRLRACSTGHNRPPACDRAVPRPEDFRRRAAPDRASQS